MDSATSLDILLKLKEIEARIEELERKTKSLSEADVRMSDKTLQLFGEAIKQIIEARR